MALSPGFYIIEKDELGKAVARPKETMSIVAFLRALHSGQELPKEICVTGLDRLLYQVKDRRKAAGMITQTYYNPAVLNRLHRQAPVVIFPVEYLELAAQWRAGIRRGSEKEAVLNIAWIFPKADITSINTTDVIYSPF